MILKVADALKSLRRTDPDCEACRDLIGLYFPPRALGGRFIYTEYTGQPECLMLHLSDYKDR